jgi:hypothetical protein
LGGPRCWLTCTERAGRVRPLPLAPLSAGPREPIATIRRFQKHGHHHQVLVPPALAQAAAELCGGHLRVAAAQVGRAHGAEQRAAAARAVDLEPLRAAVCERVDQPREPPRRPAVQARAEQSRDAPQPHARVGRVTLQPLRCVEEVLARRAGRSTAQQQRRLHRPGVASRVAAAAAARGSSASSCRLLLLLLLLLKREEARWLLKQRRGVRRRRER